MPMCECRNFSGECRKILSLSGFGSDEGSGGQIKAIQHFLASHWWTETSRGLSLAAGLTSEEAHGIHHIYTLCHGIISW